MRLFEQLFSKKISFRSLNKDQYFTAVRNCNNFATPLDETTLQDLIFMINILFSRVFGLIYLVSLTSINLQAQVKNQEVGTDSVVSIVNAEEPQTFEIGGIEVTGAEYTDPNGIVSISGLVRGASIKIPGDDIPNAIRKLWKQGLFLDVQVLLKKRVGDLIFLEIVVQEQARFARHGYRGVKKAMHDDLNAVVNRYLVKGKAATPSMKVNATKAIKDFFIEKGFLDVQVDVETEEDEILKNSVHLVFNINRGRKVRIKAVNFKGNKMAKASRLRKAMKETKRQGILSIFKVSKFVKKAYEADKNNVIAYYNTIGHRDARILKDTIYLVEIQKKNRVKKQLHIDITIDEGNVYRFGNIRFRGNTSYTDEQLHRLLGISKGDLYNETLLQTRLNYDPTGRDISTQYMDNGYLFFQVNPIEKGIENDSVDIEIRISEGPIARVGEVRIFGNDRTHEHVIRRELRVMPGDKFSRSAIIRSQRELAALGLFDPEQMTVNTPVNPQRGTVDVDFGVAERPSDQLELSAGWGGVGQGIIGTLGVTFNNFSLSNLLKPETWSPLPQGDGQHLSLRVQTNGRFYQSYNFSLTEPWLGGKKPTSFTAQVNHSVFSNGFSKESSSFSQLLITGASISVGTRLRWPDDFFGSRTTLGYQRMGLLRRLEFEIPTGIFHNLSLSQTLSRSNIGDPIFPRNGSNIALTAKLTLPYSLFSPNEDYENMNPADKFRLVEYHRWDLLTEWYTSLTKNKRFVLRLRTKMGFLGYYNADLGLSPFERYELGGDGISNFVGIQGRDIISLRGYRDPVGDVSPANEKGAAIYNKFTAEFRYLISPSPSATVYVLAFLEGGNAWSSFGEYNPFNLKRSTGLGVRVYLPMFGTLGFDYGIGFDKPHLNGSRKLTDYGAFNIILGFEPQ